MASNLHYSPEGLGEAFQKPLLTKEVEGWLGRATPAERERFEKVFESIRSIAEAKKSPDAHAKFVESTLSKLKQRSASASRQKVRATPLVRGSSAAICNGWSYTATRTAYERPETRTALLSAQEKATAEHETALREQQRQLELDLKDIEAERPQSAPQSSGVGAADRDLSALQQAAARRRALSFGVGSGSSSSAAATANPATAAALDAAAAAIAAATPPPSNLGGARHGGGATGVASMSGRGEAANGFVPISPHATRYQETYNLRSAYPEIYDQAVRDTRAESVPNQTFTSEWGASLKAGSDETSKLYWKSTYNTINDEVVKWKTDADLTREREFFKWMQRQKTFYGDLLSKSKAKDLDELLAAATEEQKREILEAMRGSHAAADAGFDRTRSHSQAIHGYMRRVEDEELEKMLREHTKVRTMGQSVTRHSVAKRRPATANAATGSTAGSMAVELKPNTVNLTVGSASAEAAAEPGKGLKPSRRPATAGAALVTRRSSVLKPQRAVEDKMETFRSKLPLTWPSGAIGPNVSTYVDTFGGSKLGADRVRPSSALLKAEPVRHTVTTVPFGAVNPYTATAPIRTAYPVPERFTTPAGIIAFPQPEGMTSYRAEFAPRDPADVAVQMRAAAALVDNSRKLLNRGTVPMGPKNGCNVLPSAQWISETKDSFVEHHVDPRGPYERGQAMKAMFTAPTGTGGKMTMGPKHPRKPAQTQQTAEPQSS